MKTRLILLGLFSVAAWAQQFDFKLLDKLGKNAKETANVTLDENLLKMGASLMGGDDKDAQQLKDVVKGIKGIVIRSFEYEKEGMYNATDLEPVRAYLRTLNWSKIVNVKSAEETSEIYLNLPSEGRLGGLAIVTTEPKEVTVVYISGDINVAKIGALSGKMGLPEIDLGNAGKAAASKGKKPAKDEEN